MNKKKVMLSIVMLVFVVSLSGCGTISGVGNDLGAIGGWIAGASDHVKENVGKNRSESSME